MGKKVKGGVNLITIRKATKKARTQELLCDEGSTCQHQAAVETQKVTKNL